MLELLIRIMKNSYTGRYNTNRSRNNDQNRSDL